MSSRKTAAMRWGWLVAGIATFALHATHVASVWGQAAGPLDLPAPPRLDALLPATQPSAAASQPSDGNERTVWLEQSEPVRFLTLHPCSTAEEANRRELPGPPLPGKFDNEVLHWMDIEYWKDHPFELNGRGWLYGPAGVRGQDGDTRLSREETVLRYTYAQGMGALGGLLKARNLHVSGRPTLPDTGGKLPEDLTFLQAGVSFPWLCPPGLWNVSFGSASDRPFASGDEMTADVSWFLGSLYSGAGSSFVFYVDWQNNRDFLNWLPIPGFLYRYKEGDWLTVVAGFPDNAIAWRPAEWLELSASYTFPRTVHSEIGLLPCRDVKFFGAFDWTNDRFYRHDRQDREDRLWYVEKTVSGGIRWEHNNTIFLEGRAGYAFDRFWFEGARYEDRSFNRINLSDGPFLQLTFGIRF